MSTAQKISKGKRSPATKRTTKSAGVWYPRPGERVLIRTVTHFHVGEVAGIEGGWISLREASWVADTGRFHQAMVNGTLNEIEPFGVPVCVAIGAVVDIAPWKHALPGGQK